MGREQCGDKAVMGNEQVENGRKSKKDKAHRKDKKEKKKDKGHGREGDGSVYSGSRKHVVMKEQAEASGLIAENPISEHAKGGMNKSDVKKEKKRKKGKGGLTAFKEQATDPTDEILGLEHLTRDKGEAGHDIKSKKGKRKRQDGGTASDGPAGGIIVSGDDKKRKRKKNGSVALEEGKQVDVSKEEKKEGKIKRRKGNDNSGQDLRQNIPAGDGKNGNKEETKSKDENEGGTRKEEKVLRKRKSRRVSFTDAVEVFGADCGDVKVGDGSDDSRLVRGRRFTSEEDKILMEAMMKYAEMKQLGEKGLEMIYDCRNHPEVSGCWAEIAKSLPHRPAGPVYNRCRILLGRSAERKWTPEEYEEIRRHVEKHGTKWKKLATDLGKSNIHVKDTWRRIKHKNLKKGPWSQDEYQNLFDLVNADLRMKAHLTFDPTHRNIRDNISWEAISDKLTTRSNHQCCLKWYQQLTSPLVKQGTWADTDDYLLVEALQKVDAVCIEDVDWENLLDHRSGEVCRKRWNQMVRLLGGHREKPFIEVVEVLSRRYCQEMFDYRK